MYHVRAVNLSSAPTKWVIVAIGSGVRGGGGEGRPHGLKYSGQTLFSGQAQVAQKS